MSDERTLQERLEYWRNHDLKNGWTTGASGPCCDKCRMTKPKDPLQALCGCRDPFQIECECHIPSRRAFRQAMVETLEAILQSSNVPLRQEIFSEVLTQLSMLYNERDNREELGRGIALCEHAVREMRSRCISDGGQKP